MAITTTAVPSYQQAAPEEGCDRIKITVREAAVLLAVEHLHAPAYPAPVPVPALGEAEGELDVPKNGCISAISAMILNPPLGKMS